jgi:hypothetical protein
LQELRAGRPTITGQPTFRGGVAVTTITFSDGTTQNTAGSSYTTIVSTKGWDSTPRTGTNTTLGPCVAGSTRTATFNANAVDIIFHGLLSNTNSAQRIYVSVLLDGNFIDKFSSALNNAMSMVDDNASGTHGQMVDIYYRTDTAVTAGSHSLCVTIATDGSTWHLNESGDGSTLKAPSWFEVRDTR